MQENKLANISLEVRKAFRLLHDYQRSMLDLVNYIGNRFGCRYIGAKPLFSASTLRNYSNAFDRWSWDWLNFYYVGFMFAKNDKSRNNLMVIVLSDSGFFEKELKFQQRVEPDSFEHVDSSKTKIILVAGNHIPDNFIEVFKNLNVEKLNKEQYASNEKVVYKAYNLDDFADEHITIETLKSFQQIAVNQNIDLALEGELIKKELTH